MSTAPATSQTTFFATAPPVSTTFVAALTVRSSAIWKIHTSVAVPVSVRGKRAHAAGRRSRGQTTFFALSGASPRRSDGSLTRRGRPLRPGGTPLRVSHGPLRRAEGILRRSDAPPCVRDLPASGSHVSLRLADSVLRRSGASLGRVDRILRPSGGVIRRADRPLRVARRPLWARDRCNAVQPKADAGNPHGSVPRPVPPWARGQPLSPCLHSAASHWSAHGGQALGTTPKRAPPSARAPCRSTTMGAPLGGVHRLMSVSRDELRRSSQLGAQPRIRSVVLARVPPPEGRTRANALRECSARGDFRSTRFQSFPRFHWMRFRSCRRFPPWCWDSRSTHWPSGQRGGRRAGQTEKESRRGSLGGFSIAGARRWTSARCIRLAKWLRARRARLGDYRLCVPRSYVGKEPLAHPVVGRCGPLVG